MRNRTSESKKNRKHKKLDVNSALKKSPINYFSDLFIVAMVCMWIADNVYQSLIASAVTISSIIMSFQTGIPNYDTSMWSSIGSNVVVPLSCGGGIWMIKNSVQHAIAYSKNKRAHQDFPAVDGATNSEIDFVEQPVDLPDSQEDPQENSQENSWEE